MSVFFRSSCQCAAIAITLFAALRAQATVIEFEDSTGLSNHFSVHTHGAEDDGGYVWSGAAGLGGSSGRLDVLPTSGHSFSTLFASYTFDLNTAPISASFFFRSAAPVANTVTPRIALLLHTEREGVNLGALNLKSLWLQDGDAHPPGRLIAGGGSDMAEQSRLGGLTAGNWYSFSATWALGADDASVELTSELWDHGADGNADASLVATLSTRITDTALFGNGGVVAPLYLGIMAQHGLGGADMIDRIRISGDFSPVAVPEPSLAALAFVFAAVLLGLKRSTRRP